MVEIGRNHQQTRVLFADRQLIDATMRRRIKTSVEHSDLDQAANDEKPIGASLMQAPGTMPARKCRGQMHLDHRIADDVPAGADDLGNMAVFVWNRTSRAKNEVVDRLKPELSFAVDRR